MGRELLARAGRGPDLGPTVPAWRPSRPHPAAGVEPWLQLTPDAPTADTRVGPGVGPAVVATLETFGGITGPSVAATEGGDRPPVVLGGAPLPVGSPPPDTPGAFRRQCAIAVVLRADELPRGRQCLLVFAVRADGPSHRAIVQSFAGVVPIAEDLVEGEDRLAFAIDADDRGGLAIDLSLRLCGTDPGTRLGLRGVVGYLL